MAMRDNPLPKVAWVSPSLPSALGWSILTGPCPTCLGSLSMHWLAFSPLGPLSPWLRTAGSWLHTDIFQGGVAEEKSWSQQDIGGEGAWKAVTGCSVPAAPCTAPFLWAFLE